MGITVYVASAPNRFSFLFGDKFITKKSETGLKSSLLINTLFKNLLSSKTTKASAPEISSGAGANNNLETVDKMA